MSKFSFHKTDNFPLKLWDSHGAFEEGAMEQLRKCAQLPFIHKHVAGMPDVHWGCGATIGSVIATKGAIVPAAVGVDIGCFSGSTAVKTSLGSIPIRTLAEKGEKFIAFSATPEGEIKAAYATASLTRAGASVVEVTLDNGDIIKCTPDHEFMLRDGTYLKAESLTNDTSLMPFYSRINKDDHVSVRQPYSGKETRVHRMMAWAGMLGDIPVYGDDDTIIHHIDFDGTNNDIKNLKFMKRREHCSYHASIKERNTHWQSESFEKKRIAGIRESAKTEKGHTRMSEQGTANIKKYMAERPDHFRKSVKDNGKRGREYLIAYNKSPEAKAKTQEPHECPECGGIYKGPAGIVSHRRAKHPNSYQNNHKVVGVSKTVGKEDVYCLTVPEYGNFALGAGVFVHNCGMMAVKTSLVASDLPDDLFGIRCAIESAVPHGRTDNGGKNDRGGWGDIPEYTGVMWDNALKHGYERIIAKHPKAKAFNTISHLGTLGTGNHFIEVCLDEEDRVWVMLHSGSRGAGNRIGSYFIERAKREMERWHIDKYLPDADLSYFVENTEIFDDYVLAVKWAQEFAQVNRTLMMEDVMGVLWSYISKPFTTEDHAINCHHNYIAKEHHFNANVWITRKGAVRARKGDLGIIPGSMGTGSFIVRGLGNKDSFHSCSHGAGRVMSRGQAKKVISLEDHAKATEGIECRKDAGVIDESPAAYKDIGAVMEAQDDLVEIVARLRQVINVKG